MRALGTKIGGSGVLGVICVILLVGCSNAPKSSTFNIEKLSQAIFWAEGGYRTAHPFGILKGCDAGEAGQCEYLAGEILRIYLQRYRALPKKQGDFISYLARHWAPVNAENDPKGLNRNFERNVRYFYTKGTS